MVHEFRILRRRASVASFKVATRYIDAGRLSLTDPAFNLREFVKQLILLEDHLVQPHKRCSDCIRKHLLTAEALAEEATALDKTGVWGKKPAVLAAMVRRWSERFLDGEDPSSMSQQIRELRKGLTPLVFDPRKPEIKVAAFYSARPPA